MIRISDSVRRMEDELEAYRRVLTAVLEKSSVQMSEAEFQKLMPYLQTLKLNHMMSHCPFPRDCLSYGTCTERECNANDCWMGYAYRRS